jgi:two-component system, NtrC family, response regulator AtoC
MAAILVVDDEQGLREVLAEALASHGHDVVSAEDGDAALRVLQGSSFDLMLTDLRMPGKVDGLELVRRCRADMPEMEVIVLTAHGTVETAVEAMKLGAFDFLQKPFGSLAALRMVVTRALERRTLVAKDEVQRQAHPVAPLTYGDPVMEPVVKAIARVAGTHASVLLLGETGTGKELAARAIHDGSGRARGPFVAVNCAAISETLMESEIFGHEKGAFTGANATRRGRLELANGGTLFLDEIGELKLELQAKLLRVIQEARFERLGGTRAISVDVRWIAATNRDLDAMVAGGTFRDDLYHRLAVFPIQLPPLRERRQDLPPLVEFLLRRIVVDLGRGPVGLDEEAWEKIRGCPWRGNVRELANVLERAVIMTDADTIRGGDLRIPTLPAGASAGARTIQELERDAIRAALVAVGGNRRRAAEQLGIGERTLYEKLKRYGLE